MIDPTDKKTQTLALDEPPAKRKRGRPATGQAMTAAEKQRAYRERLNADTVVLDRAERTAIVSMLQDKAREISTRVLCGGPVTPHELKSAEWLSTLAHRIAMVGRR